jgi:hypothetical protein
VFESFLFFRIGPDKLRPKMFLLYLSKREEDSISDPPKNLLEGPFVVMEIIPAVASPYWAGKPPAITVICSMADCGTPKLPLTFIPSI